VEEGSPPILLSFKSSNHLPLPLLTLAMLPVSPLPAPTPSPSPPDVSSQHSFAGQGQGQGQGSGSFRFFPPQSGATFEEDQFDARDFQDHPIYESELPLRDDDDEFGGFEGQDEGAFAPPPAKGSQLLRPTSSVTSSPPGSPFASPGLSRPKAVIQVPRTELNGEPSERGRLQEKHKPAAAVEVRIFSTLFFFFGKPLLPPHRVVLSPRRPLLRSSQTLPTLTPPRLWRLKSRLFFFFYFSLFESTSPLTH